jgi:hypothetical protein
MNRVRRLAFVTVIALVVMGTAAGGMFRAGTRTAAAAWLWQAQTPEEICSAAQQQLRVPGRAGLFQ